MRFGNIKGSKTVPVCNIGHFDNEIDTAMRENRSWVEVKDQVHMIKRSDKQAIT